MLRAEDLGAALTFPIPADIRGTSGGSGVLLIAGHRLARSGRYVALLRRVGGRARPDT
jgi:hypothetical protein